MKIGERLATVTEVGYKARNTGAGTTHRIASDSGEAEIVELEKELGPIETPTGKGIIVGADTASKEDNDCE